MARFKIIEKAITYKEYWIDNVNSFEAARKLWINNDSKIDEAASCAEWEQKDAVELDCIENENGEVCWYN